MNTDMPSYIRNKFIFRSGDGFTLIELLVTIALTAVLATAGFLALNGYRDHQKLVMAAKNLEAVLEGARSNSQTQASGHSWGVEFDNTNAQNGNYSLFWGSFSSSTVTQTYALGSSVEFLDPVAGATTSVTFSSITGYPPAYFSVTLALISDAEDQIIIEVTPQGLVSSAPASALVVTAIDPASGANNGTVSGITISGNGFASGATVALQMSGQPSISGTGFATQSMEQLAGGSFDLTNAATGVWNVVVTNPSGASSTLTNAFTIRVPAPVVTSVSPLSGTTGQIISGVSASGAYFQNGATVALQMSGQSSITGSGFTFASSTSLTGGSFNLTNATSGSWNVAVTNPDGQVGVDFNGFTVNPVISTGTINATYQYAWNDNIGWVQFASSSSNVVVTNTGLTGYAWNANEGLISLNCSNDNSCGTVNYGVTNTATGTLAGYAWNDQIGWISFSCSNAGTCGTVNYGVTIGSNGDFSGYAWNDNVGWISFNCADGGTCATSNYKVNTSWRPQ